MDHFGVWGRPSWAGNVMGWLQFEVSHSSTVRTARIYFSVIDFNIFNSIVALANIRSSIMRWWPREFNPHPPQFVSCLSQFSNTTATRAASWCGSRLIQSSINQTITSRKVSLNREEDTHSGCSPSPCLVSSPISRLAGVVLLSVEVTSLCCVSQLSKKPNIIWQLLESQHAWWRLFLKCVWKAIPVWKCDFLVKCKLT